MTRKAKGVLALVLTALLAPVTVAEAAPPTNLSASQSGRIVTASWTLPSSPTDVFTGYLEFAPTPATDAYGFFAHPDTISVEYNTNETTFNSSPFQFPAGSYFVHVSAVDPATCAPTPDDCVDEFSGVITLVVPPDPPPPTPPAPAAPPAPPAPPPDTVTAFSSLSAPGSQKVAKLFVQAGMSEAGTITAAGTVSVPKLSKVYKFKTASAPVAAGATVKLKLKLAKKALKAVRKALKKGKKLKAKLTITATDGAGNRKVEKRTVKLKL